MKFKELEDLVKKIEYSYIKYTENYENIDIVFEALENYEDFSELTKIAKIERYDDRIYVYLTKEDKWKQQMKNYVII